MQYFGKDMNNRLELNFLAHPVCHYRLLMFTTTRSVCRTKYNL